MQPGQIASLLGVLKEPASTMVLLGVLTGLRIGEILALTWAYVDFIAGEIENHTPELRLFVWDLSRHKVKLEPWGARASGLRTRPGGHKVRPAVAQVLRTLA